MLADMKLPLLFTNIHLIEFLWPQEVWCYPHLCSYLITGGCPVQKSPKLL